MIETVTGTKQAADPVFVRMYESPYKLEFSDKMSANFMPGFPYNVLVRNDALKFFVIMIYISYILDYYEFKSPHLDQYN